MTTGFARIMLTKIPPARLFAIAGGLAIAIPTLLTVARLHWTSTEGTQGPIILATATWLLWRSRSVMTSQAARPAGIMWIAAFVLLVPVHVFARIYAVLPLETLTAYLMGVVAAVIYLGPSLVRRLWFPFLYPAFLIVPPVTIAADLTLPLKLSISAFCVNWLYSLGYPVALSGATIQIGQYELLVRQACAGMGSLLTLCAVGLFYVHLRTDANLRSSIALLAAIVPIAIIANIIRVVLLVLLTWYFGAGVGQGIAHDSAGVLMFTVAMVLMFAVSSFLDALGRDRGTRNA